MRANVHKLVHSMLFVAAFCFAFLNAFMELVMKKNVLMLICVLPVVFLAACRNTAPQDLKLESVNTIKLSDLPGGVWSAVQSRNDARGDAVSLFKINFSSQFDFVKLAKADGLNISYRAFKCGDESIENQPLFVIPDLRINDFSLEGGAYSGISELERFRDSNGRLTYNLLMPIAGDELKRLFGNDATPGKVPYFNPHEPRADICLQVVAAAMWFGRTMQSNVMRVSAPKLIDSE